MRPLQCHRPSPSGRVIGTAPIACLVFALIPAPLRAQEAGRLWPGLDPARLPIVYVLDDTGSETAGRLLRIDTDALVILAGGAERRFEADRIRRLDRRGDSVRNGALIGAIAGVALGTLGAGMADCPGGDPGSRCPGTRAAVVLTSTALWASIGTAIDAAIPGRTTIYVAPEASPAARDRRPSPIARGRGISLTLR